MTCRGVHFAITATQVRALRKAAGDDDDVMDLVAAIEEAWDGEHLAESDKAWDAMHRCLTDGQLDVLPKDYAPEYGEEDFGYTWSNFEDVRALYARAAGAKRAVIFTTSQ